MAAAIKEKTGYESEFVASSGGIFEVSLDGTVVWTNDANRGYKPTNEEVLAVFPGA